MKCIFCLQEKEPSEEHVIPESIGGTICIQAVCRDCNSNLSNATDGPFANCHLVELARYVHEIGGKRDKVPFPFGEVGTLPSGQKITLDREFEPNLKRVLNVTEAAEALHIEFRADAADKGNLDNMLAKPLRKLISKKFPEWPDTKLDAEIEKILVVARSQTPTPERNPIKYSWSIKIDDFAFEFSKIAYEFWFKYFGYGWVEQSPSALALRNCLINRDATQPINGLVPAPPLPIAVPFDDPKNNHILLLSGGACFIRLFRTCGIIHCETTDARFQFREEDTRLVVQPFNGKAIDEKLTDIAQTTAQR